MEAPEFWRRTPPALFPSVFGLFGLGLAWRAAASFAPLGISPWIGHGILLCVGLLYLFGLACYLSKLGARPLVVLEDMASIPGRAGVATLTLCLFLFAAAILPFSALAAQALLFLGLAAHLIVALLAILVMLRTPQGLVVTPVWHLSFVGFILAGLSAAPLGFGGLAQTILAICVLVSALIYGISLLQLKQAEVPAPQRPLLVIHLAPVSLFTSVAALLDRGFFALVFGTLAIALAGVLASRALFLVKAGFSPLWGAFTFPVAAFASALFMIAPQIALFGWVALLPLGLASILTPLIALRVFRMWSTGALAAKTGAAVA